MKNSKSINEGRTKLAPKNPNVKTAPPPAPKKAVKTAKPKLSKVPQFDNGGRAYFVIRELEDGGMNTQIHGEGAKVAAMLSAALKSQPELRMMLLIGLI